MFLPLHEGHEHANSTGEVELIVAAALTVAVLALVAYGLKSLSS